MKTLILAAVAALAIAPALAQQTTSVGGQIGTGDTLKNGGPFVVESRAGTARILEIVEDPADASIPLRASPCGGFVPVTRSGGGGCITSDVTITRSEQ